MKKTTFAVLIFLLLTCLGGWAQQLHFIFLVRHAEKQSSAADALLSDKGLKRADCLAKTLQDAGIGYIYATEVKRTQQTAAPLAQLLKLEPRIIPRAQTDELIRRLKEDGPKNVLVVNHSDLLPKIISETGGGKVEVSDQDYDKLFVIARDANGGSNLTVIHYCELQ